MNEPSTPASPTPAGPPLPEALIADIRAAVAAGEQKAWEGAPDRPYPTKLAACQHMIIEALRVVLPAYAALLADHDAARARERQRARADAHARQAKRVLVWEADGQDDGDEWTPLRGLPSEDPSGGLDVEYLDADRTQQGEPEPPRLPDVWTLHWAVAARCDDLVGVYATLHAAGEQARVALGWPESRERFDPDTAQWRGSHDEPFIFRLYASRREDGRPAFTGLEIRWHILWGAEDPEQGQ